MLLYSVGFMPVALIVTAVIAVLADVWLYRTPGGLAARAMGLDEEAAARRGVRVAYLFIRAFFITAFAAALGGLVPRRPGPDRRPERRLQLHAHEHRRRRARRRQPARRSRLVHRRRRRRPVPQRDHQHPAVPRLECVVRPDHGRAADARRAVLLPGARAHPAGEDGDRQLPPVARRVGRARRRGADGCRSRAWSRSRRSAT